MIKEAIHKVIDGESLSRDEAAAAMRSIMDGGATEAQIASLITALRIKGETVNEITGFAQVMREKARTIRPRAQIIVDTCGTGGDVADTFNISTATALVVAGAGVAVAKHGNRSVSSACGSADVLEALGVRVELEPEAVKESIDRVGIGFMFAPLFHPAMKYAVGPRREIGARTVFNILGPLTNPAGATSQVLGVYDPGLTDTMARVLGELGTPRALVVHGDGLDELTTTGPTTVAELKDGRVLNYVLEPEDLGIAKAEKGDLAGGDAEVNAGIIMKVLEGEDGPRRDIVVLNAGAALHTADLVESLNDGMRLAGESIDRREALNRLEQLSEFTKTAV